jgi:hypothetical protein
VRPGAQRLGLGAYAAGSGLAGRRRHAPASAVSAGRSAAPSARHDGTRHDKDRHDGIRHDKARHDGASMP